MTMSSPDSPSSTAQEQASLPADLQDERLISSQGVGRGAVRAFIAARLRSGVTSVRCPSSWASSSSGECSRRSDSSFLSSRNLVNLTSEALRVGTIAIGIVLVLL